MGKRHLVKVAPPVFVGIVLSLAISMFSHASMKNSALEVPPCDVLHACTFSPCTPNNPSVPCLANSDDIALNPNTLETAMLQPPEAIVKPNIVLIMADDFGYENVGAYGGISYPTPILDALAATGMRFEQAHAQPLCTPSRVQIMTGLYNFRNYTQFGQLPPGQRTFAHMLKEAGYRTVVTGKWHLAASGGTRPEEAGFDEYSLYNVRSAGSRYWDPELITNGVHEVHEAAFGPDLFTDYINDFMERYRDLPFFVYYPMVLPHKPLVSTPDDPNATTEQERYTAMVAYLDKMVGKIVHKLNELGLRDKTLILFTGDNGTSNSIISQVGAELIRGGKGRPTDAGTRVPLIANWPGTIPAGVVNTNIVDITIFFPTLAEAAGAVMSERLDGQSILDQLRGKPGTPRGWIYVFYYPNKKDHFDKYSAEFVRDVRYKLYGVGRFEGLFFDVQTDVLEQYPIPPGRGGQEAETARIKLQGILANIQAQQGIK